MTVNTTTPGLHHVGEWIKPTHTLATVPKFDVLVVPGGVGARGLLTGQLGPTVAFINATYPRVQYLLSICTGNAIAAASVSRLYRVSDAAA